MNDHLALAPVGLGYPRESRTRLTSEDRATVTVAMDLLTAYDRWHAGEQAPLVDFLAASLPGPVGLLSLDVIPWAGFGFACGNLRNLLALVERLDGDRPAPVPWYARGERTQ